MDMEKPIHSPAGLEIIEALTELRDALRSGEPIETRFTVRTVELNLEPRDNSPGDVRNVRTLLNVSQALFARILGVSVKTVRAWEQGVRPVNSMASRFMDEIAATPQHWRDRIDECYKAKGAPSA